MANTPLTYKGAQIHFDGGMNIIDDFGMPDPKTDFYKKIAQEMFGPRAMTKEWFQNYLYGNKHTTSIAGRSQISEEEALDKGLDISKLVRVSPGSNYFYKPPKEYPVAKVESKVRKARKPAAYKTIGVRFLDGNNLAKTYTYRAPKKAKLHLGQEVVVPTDKTGAGYITRSVAVVVELHTSQQDTGGYDYKFITGTIKPL